MFVRPSEYSDPQLGLHSDKVITRRKLIDEGDGYKKGHPFCSPAQKIKPPVNFIADER